MNNEKTYTVKEASRLSGLPASTLRYYESIGIIHPIARDNSSKQRVYTEEDLHRIDSVACLHATGLSLDNMKIYLENAARGKDAARQEIELLRNQIGKLEAESQYLELRKQYVKLKIQYWQSVETGDEPTREEILKKAHDLSQQLKFPNI